MKEQGKTKTMEEIRECQDRIREIKQQLKQKKWILFGVEKIKNTEEDTRSCMVEIFDKQNHHFMWEQAKQCENELNKMWEKTKSCQMELEEEIKRENQEFEVKDKKIREEYCKKRSILLKEEENERENEQIKMKDRIRRIKEKYLNQVQAAELVMQETINQMNQFNNTKSSSYSSNILRNEKSMKDQSILFNPIAIDGYKNQLKRNSLSSSTCAYNNNNTIDMDSQFQKQCDYDKENWKKDINISNTSILPSKNSQKYSQLQEMKDKRLLEINNSQNNSIQDERINLEYLNCSCSPLSSCQNASYLQKGYQKQSKNSLNSSEYIQGNNREVFSLIQKYRGNNSIKRVENSQHTYSTIASLERKEGVQGIGHSLSRPNSLASTNRGLKEISFDILSQKSTFDKQQQQVNQQHQRYLPTNKNKIPVNHIQDKRDKPINLNDRDMSKLTLVERILDSSSSEEEENIYDY